MTRNESSAGSEGLEGNVRYSKVFGKTLREVPRGVRERGTELLVRGGFLRFSSRGTVLLPLGFRVLEKLSRLLEELSTSLEMQMVAAPESPESAGPDEGAARKRGKGRGETEQTLGRCFLAGAHRQNLSVLVPAPPLTYRELPLFLSLRRWADQQESGGKGEILVQAFYSFDASREACGESCLRLKELCRHLFRTVGLEGLWLDPETSTQGSPPSDEFLVFQAEGREEILCCDACSYAAARERGRSLVPPFEQNEPALPRQVLVGRGLVSTRELAAYAGIPVEKTTKTLLFEADGRLVAVYIRGDYDISEAKLEGWLGCSRLQLASAEQVREITGADVGYAGPVGLPEGVEVLWDRTTQNRVNFEAGANQTDHHYLNLNFGRDLPQPQVFADLRRVQAGERCEECQQGKLRLHRAVKVAQISCLQDLRRQWPDLTFPAADGRLYPLWIGCCGIDLSCLLRLLVEQHSDDQGIRWPPLLSPFAAHLVSLPGGEEPAREIYRRLREEGVEVLWDDREAPAGAKFKDADLIGIPVRLVLSRRTAGQVEWKERGAAHPESFSAQEVLRRLTSWPLTEGASRGRDSR